MVYEPRPSRCLLRASYEYSGGGAYKTSPLDINLPSEGSVCVCDLTETLGVVGTSTGGDAKDAAPVKKSMQQVTITTRIIDLTKSGPNKSAILVGGQKNAGHNRLY
jgi:hypothetical protein